jgi:hypothetical protein
MKTRFPQFPPPFLTPNHQRNNWEEESKEDSGERKPSPEIADSCSEGQGEVADDEAEASTEVEEDA